MTNYSLSNNYSLDEPYISIYDRPKRARGRPKIYTDEEIKQHRRDYAKKVYYENYEYRLMQIKLYQERKKEEKK